MLPERFGEDLGGAQVQVTALVRDVKARSLPDVDDEFAKTASGSTRGPAPRRPPGATDRHEGARGTGRDRDLALQALIDTVDVDLPDTLIEEETDHRMHHARDRAERMGIGLEKMLELQGWDEDRLREDSRDRDPRDRRATSSWRRRWRIAR